MSNIIVIAFDDMEQAGQARESLHKMENEGYLSLDDAEVLVKDEDGKLHLKGQMDTGVKWGAVGGGILGLIIGGFLFPIAGLLIGVLGGALVGKTLNLGIDKKFVEDVKEAMKPGTSALFLLVRESNHDAAMATLRQYHGTVLQTSLNPEDEATLKDALK